jgi:hypothetical protein
MNAFMVGQQHVVIITATVATAAEGHIDLIVYGLLRLDTSGRQGVVFNST